jgi:signal peptidase I
MNLIKRAIAAVFDFLQGIVVILAVMVMIYLFIMSPQEINGQSMDPTFHNGEYILTNKIEFKLINPKRGEIVIFKSPQNKDIDYIKRIIGLPGERLKLVNSSFYINDVKLDESSYLTPDVITYAGSFLHENEEITVAEGKYFVCGDNRQHSSDSREFGPIAVDDFIGRAIFRYWPFSRTGLIIQPQYLLGN